MSRRVEEMVAVKLAMTSLEVANTIGKKVVLAIRRITINSKKALQLSLPLLKFEIKTNFEILKLFNSIWSKLRFAATFSIPVAHHTNPIIFFPQSSYEIFLAF